MAAPVETQLVRYTPVELVDAVRTGRIRYPNPAHPSAADVARTLDGIGRGYPQRLVLLWRDPADGPGSPLWLLDGGDFVSALLMAAGLTERWASDEPVSLDTDTGEVVSWGQRPDRQHVTVDVRALLTADDPESVLTSERLAGPRADRVLEFVGSMQKQPVTAQVTELPRAELPSLFRHLPMRRGVEITDIEPTVGPVPGPAAGWFAWDPAPRSLVVLAHLHQVGDTSDSDVWRMLLVAEGQDPETPYEATAATSDLPDEGRAAVRAVGEAQEFLRGAAGFGAGSLLPDVSSVAVIARFLRVFSPVDQAVWPLLRRWVWRAALGDGELDLSVSALAVIRDDPAASAVRLLERTPIPDPSPPGRTEVDLTARRGRLVALGLASLHPRDLPTRVLVDVEQVGLRKVLPDRPAEIANLMFHEYPYLSGFWDVVDAVLATDDAELLAGHGIDAVAVDLLRTRDDDGFLARRAALLDRLILEFWATMTEPSAVTRRPVALLFGDDDG